MFAALSSGETGPVEWPGKERGVSIGALGEERPHHLEAAALGREHRAVEPLGSLALTSAPSASSALTVSESPNFGGSP